MSRFENKRKTAGSVFLYAILILGFYCINVSYAYGQNYSPQELFTQANLFYRENKYDEAIAAYENILGQGLESGNLYYNLANSYFKKGEMGKAVLNYERAKLCIPNDSDLIVNYEYAKSLLDTAHEEPQYAWYARLPDKFFGGMSAGFLTIILSAAYIAFFLILILRMAFPAFRRVAAWCIAFIVPVFILGIVSLKIRTAFIQRGAVVISKEIPAAFEPLESATTHFTLSEGSKVEVIEPGVSWCKIKRFDGKTGWVKKSGLEFIRIESSTRTPGS